MKPCVTKKNIKKKLLQIFIIQLDFTSGSFKYIHGTIIRTGMTQKKVPCNFYDKNNKV